MTTELQVTANGRNAARSTGPKTAAGKARSARNALRHGLRSDLPVLPGERPGEWEAHRDGIVRSLAPAGGLETALAERVALGLWRLRRVTAYETAVTAQGIEEVSEKTRRQREEADDSAHPFLPDSDLGLAGRLAEAEKELREVRQRQAEAAGPSRLLERLADLPPETPLPPGDALWGLDSLHETAVDYGAKRLPCPQGEAFLAGLGVPADEVADAEEWAGWTAAMVQLGWRKIAEAAKVRPEKLLARAVEGMRELAAANAEYARKRAKAIKDLRRRIKVQEERLRQRLR
jgi:hypothetical protein